MSKPDNVTRTRMLVLVPLLALFVLASVLTGTASGRPTGPGATKPTIVLVHGAFADASSWNGVTELLQRRGYKVVAPANPLRGLTSDSAYLASLLQQIPGPVLLVGHSYGGAVMTNAATHAANVVGLVYVAAFAPAQGEVLSQVEAGSTDSVLNSALIPFNYPAPDESTAVELIVDPAKFHDVFAADLSRKQSAILAAGQRPAAALAFNEASGPPAWASLPSWAVVATGDKAAGADIVRSQAQRAGANITYVRGSHLVMVSKPKIVADVIVKAARAVATG